MKRYFTLILLTIFCCSIFVGCSSFSGKAENADGLFVNNKLDTKKMKTITGQEIVFEKDALLLGSEEYGYAVAKPTTWKDVSDDHLNVENKANGSYIGFVPQKAIDELVNTDTESLNADEHMALYEKYYAQIIPVACIYAVNDEKSTDEDYAVPDNYDKTERITEANGNTYYLAYNTTMQENNESDITLDETEKITLKTMQDHIKDLRDNIILFPTDSEAKDATSDFKGTLTSFEAEDMTGKKVDQSIFSDYDLTMVNIWTTWCGVCVEEMPYLEKLNQQLPDNVNIISICGDASDEKELAQQILDKNDITFKTLIDNDSLNESVLKYVSGFPTTIFVDKNGNVVGDIQMGAPGENIVQGYQKLIDDRLAEVTKNK